MAPRRSTAPDMPPPSQVTAKQAIGLMELMQGTWFIFNDPSEYWRLEHPIPDGVLCEVDIYTDQTKEDEVFARLLRTGSTLEVFWPKPMTGNLVIYPKL